MARVAANQAKSVEARKQFVYKQEVTDALRRTNGKTACQEKREYTVAPGPNGVTRKIGEVGERRGKLRRRLEYERRQQAPMAALLTR